MTEIENVHFLAHAIDELERCQFPDAQCDQPSVTGIGGYCASHVGEMRRRVLTSTTETMKQSVKPFLIRLVSNALGIPEPAIDGKFLKSYDPAAHNGRGEIFATDNPRDAMKFESIEAAWECWRQEHGIRAGFDNKPNRPLTAFTIEIVPELSVIPKGPR